MFISASIEVERGYPSLKSGSVPLIIESKRDAEGSPEGVNGASRWGLNLAVVEEGLFNRVVKRSP